MVENLGLFALELSIDPAFQRIILQMIEPTMDNFDGENIIKRIRKRLDVGAPLIEGSLLWLTN